MPDIKQSKHFIMKCKNCDKVISQCRCADKNKEVVYDMCDNCKKADIKQSNMRTRKKCLTCGGYELIKIQIGKKIKSKCQACGSVQLMLKSEKLKASELFEGEEARKQWEKQIKQSKWEESFDEKFGIPQKYKPKDRRISQLKNIFDGNEVGEAVEDYAEERNELQAEAMIEHCKDIKQFIRDLLKEEIKKAEQRGFIEARRIFDKSFPK